MKNYYELLGLEPSADSDTIKKAFRREIAKYHPDKVVHLGQEFQEMASVRAAELTTAYKTLSDAALRAQYDSTLGGLPMAADPPSPATEDSSRSSAAQPVGRQFETERAGRDQILRRAVAVRVQKIVEDMYGEVQTPSVRGFDIAVVPTAKARFLGAPPPRVLVKVLDHADVAAVNEAWTNASRARVHVARSPVIVLLFAKRIAPPAELQRALGRQRKAADGPDEIAIIVLDTDDWSARLPQDVSAAVRTFVERLKR